ncbi:dATP/dGTP pyrophosphohydrolase domain-containing protein [Ampullimonas aquatilis]|uniref:dATP/dGTP pyrophosphohydrolase domain-containing protein n=1 Tax=Ampullimonas aquatilis TaxID=1341549 RepID=UPI003C791FA4
MNTPYLCPHCFSLTTLTEFSDGYTVHCNNPMCRPLRTSTSQLFNFETHLQRQREWSEVTFGPGARTQGVVDHIRKELVEILDNPSDITEWIDVVILALDGAWRAGASPQQIIDTIVAKQTKNENRKWPDWRTANPDKAIEHVRGNE